LIITGVLDLFSRKFYLYWTVWWVDMTVHFFGGISSAFAVIWLYSLTNDLKNWNTTKLLRTILVGVIFIGIVWEVYELHFGITSLSDGVNYLTDTLSDLMMDTVGGIFGFLLSRNILKKYE
jgi:hypothetical protein